MAQTIPAGAPHEAHPHAEVSFWSHYVFSTEDRKSVV